MVISNRHKLLALARKRLQRFATLIPKLLIAEDTNLVHDLRVGSRRLQQALRVLHPGAKPAKSKKLRRSLRRVRQTLGPCRNLDVNLELVKKRRQQAGPSAVQSAWAVLQAELEAKRDALIESARREVARHDSLNLIVRAKKLIDSADPDTDPMASLGDAVTTAMKTWQEAFASAKEKPDEIHLHRLRIAGKQLRYRVELLAEFGDTGTKPLVDGLKQLQDALGDWHDRAGLIIYVATFVAQAEFLAEHPDMGRVLLTEIEKEKLRNQSAVEQLLGEAAKIPEIWARWQPPHERPRQSHLEP